MATDYAQRVLVVAAVDDAATRRLVEVPHFQVDVVPADKPHRFSNECAHLTPPYAVYIADGRIVGAGAVTRPIMLELATMFRDEGLRPVMVTANVPCRGRGHLHIHMRDQIVLPRIVARGSDNDHAVLLCALLKRETLLPMCCFHATDGPVMIANDARCQLVGLDACMDFLATQDRAVQAALTLKASQGARPPKRSHT